MIHNNSRYGDFQGLSITPLEPINYLNLYMKHLATKLFNYASQRQIIEVFIRKMFRLDKLFVGAVK
jgi:hypothetical protein